MKLNVRLIRKVIKHILAEPRRYFQEDTIATGRPGKMIYGEEANGTFAKCGTAGCIAGWAYMLSRKDPDRNSSEVLAEGRDALGLTSDQADVLFTGDARGAWPSPFNQKYGEAKTQRGKARVAARLLEKVIKTNGAVLEDEDRG